MEKSNAYVTKRAQKLICCVCGSSYAGNIDDGASDI